jgi:hypothetical protein
MRLVCRLIPNLFPSEKHGNAPGIGIVLKNQCTAQNETVVKVLFQ